MHPNTRQRIAITRYLMICFIVLFHTTSAVVSREFLESHSLLNFLGIGLTRSGIPTLTLISGYLFFYRSSTEPWIQTIKKKTRVLLIPFLIWNLPFVLTIMVIQWLYPHSSHFAYQLFPINSEHLANAALSLKQTPVNYPLVFLRDLFLLFCLSPLFKVLIKYAALPGGIALGLIGYFNWDGWLFLTNLMPIMFYLGGLIATRKWDLMALDRAAPLCMGLLFLEAWGVIALPKESLFLLRMVSPLLLWPSISLLEKRPFFRFLSKRSHRSFCIYLSHALFLFPLSYLLVQPFLQGLPIVPAILLTATLAIVAGDILDHVVRVRFRALSVVIFGGR